MKRTIAAVFLGAVLLAAAGCGGRGSVSSDSTASISPQFLRQVVAADNETGRTIMWQMNDREENPAVEYRKAGSDDIRRAEGTVSHYEGRTDKKDHTYIYSAALTGLEKGTAYEYRAVTAKGKGPWASMKTDDGGPFTALIFPDSQSLDYNVWAHTATSAMNAHQDASFFINMGDLTDNGEDFNQWNSWMNAAEPLMTSIPVAPIMGNHEAYSLDWKMKRPDTYLALFDLPKNSADGYQKYFYSYDWGDVHFTVLNTQQEELKEWMPDLIKTEQAWLADDLARTKKKWKVVLMHKDVLQYAFTKNPDRKAGFSDMGKAFMPIFDQYGVDLVLTAHLHTLRDRGHIRNFQRDAKGPLYVITGVAGDVRYPGLWIDHPLDEYVAPQPETDNYLTLDAGADRLVLRAYLPDGTLLHEADVTKEK